MPELITIPENGDATWEFKNPNNKSVRCEVKSGKGEISLYKNGRHVGETYTLSNDLEDADTIYLNTSSTSTDDTNRDPITAKSGDTLRSLALQYGVREEEITSDGEKIEGEIREGQTLKIPPSRWELYLVALGPGENQFEVELVEMSEIEDEDDDD